MTPDQRAVGPQTVIIVDGGHRQRSVGVAVTVTQYCFHRLVPRVSRETYNEVLIQPFTGARLVSPRLSRTACGPMTVAPIRSTISTARATSASLVATNAAIQHQIIFQPDPHIASGQNRGGDIRHLVTTQRK